MRRNALRWWRHLWLDEADARRAVGGPAGLQRLTDVVADSETRHCGEIRLCIEASLPWRYLRRGDSAQVRARAMFSKLEVWDTEQNNGVLVYALLADRALEIVADRGVQARVRPGEWETAIQAAQRVLREQASLEAGLAAALRCVGATLERLYPREAGSGQAIDRNELPDLPALH